MQFMLDELQKLVTNQSQFARNYTVKLLRDSKWAEAGQASALLPSAKGGHDGKGYKAGKEARETEPSVIPATSFVASSTESSKGGPREIPALFATQSQSMFSNGQRDVPAGSHATASNALNARDKTRGYEVPANLGPRKGKSKGNKDSWKGQTSTMSL